MLCFFAQLLAHSFICNLRAIFLAASDFRLSYSTSTRLHWVVVTVCWSSCCCLLFAVSSLPSAVCCLRFVVCFCSVFIFFGLLLLRCLLTSCWHVRRACTRFALRFRRWHCQRQQQATKSSPFLAVVDVLLCTCWLFAIGKSTSLLVIAEFFFFLLCWLLSIAVCWQFAPFF